MTDDFKTEEFEEILEKHFKKYPLMQPEDIIKLCFQNEFGCGHIISDPNSAYKRVADEFEWVSKYSSYVQQNDAEDIGNGYCRIYLRPGHEDLAELIAKMTVFSANNSRGDTDAYQAKKEKARDFALDKIPTEETERFFRDYESMGGLSAPHHSRIYNDNYNPAYRVNLAGFGEYFNVISKIYELTKTKNAPVISIDGPACSGKTYLAGLISAIISCNVIHTDSFFLPRERKTKERMAEAGGNFDYERFNMEVAGPLSSKKAGEYGIYDCHKGYITEKKRFFANKPTLIEGSYCNHTAFGDYCDLKIFLATPEKVRRERLEKRESPESLEMFEKVWLPCEDNYFKNMQVEKRCHIVASGGLSV